MSTLLKRSSLQLMLAIVERLPASAQRRMVTRIGESLKQFPLWSDYEVTGQPRWSDASPHPAIAALLEKRNATFRQNLERFAAFGPEFGRIPLSDAPGAEPQWVNGWIPGLDAIALYGFIATRRPANYFEVGSGNSTRFVRRAISDWKTGTRILSIDNQPRAEVEAICDVSIRRKLEDSDLSVFSDLKAGDILFIDNSHRAFMNSDVTVFFLEVLPKLPAGVLVGIHDIFWPSDYLPQWADRHYTEQYFLGQYLLCRPELRLELACHYVSNTRPAAFAPQLQTLWNQLPEGVQKDGCSFWFQSPG